MRKQQVGRGIHRPSVNRPWCAVDKYLAAVVFFIGVCSVAPIQAHHAFAAVFDRDAPIQLSGTVARVEWMNPHVWFYVHVSSEMDEVEEWAFEMGSPNALVRRGWRSSMLVPGTPVNVDGYLAKDGSKRAAVETVTLESGEKLFGAQQR